MLVGERDEGKESKCCLSELILTSSLEAVCTNGQKMLRNGSDRSSSKRLQVRLRQKINGAMLEAN